MPWASTSANEVEKLYVGIWGFEYMHDCVCVSVPVYTAMHTSIRAQIKTHLCCLLYPTTAYIGRIDSAEWLATYWLVSHNGNCFARITLNITLTYSICECGNGGSSSNTNESCCWHCGRRRRRCEIQFFYKFNKPWQWNFILLHFFLRTPYPFSCREFLCRA